MHLLLKSGYLKFPSKRIGLNTYFSKAILTRTDFLCNALRSIICCLAIVIKIHRKFSRIIKIYARNS